MRCLISLLALALLCLPAMGQEPNVYQAKATASLGLQKALYDRPMANPSCNCKDCDCVGLCDCQHGTQWVKASALLMLKTARSQETLYIELRDQAIKENIPLVVGVECDPVVPKGWLGLRWDSIPEAKAGSQVVGVPHAGDMDRLDLPAGSSVPKLKEAVDRLRKSWSWTVTIEAIQPVSYFQAAPAMSSRSY